VEDPGTWEAIPPEEVIPSKPPIAAAIAQGFLSSSVIAATPVRQGGHREQALDATMHLLLLLREFV
jgi:hypothetical protein